MPSLRSLLFDLFLVAVATVAAAVTRDNFTIVAPKLIALVPYLAVTLGIAGFALPVLGISRSLWQFTSMRDGLRIVAATVIVVLSAVAIGFVVNRLDGVARSLPFAPLLLDSSCRRVAPAPQPPSWRMTWRPTPQGRILSGGRSFEVFRRLHSRQRCAPTPRLCTEPSPSVADFLAATRPASSSARHLCLDLDDDLNTAIGRQRSGARGTGVELQRLECRLTRLGRHLVQRDPNLFKLLVPLLLVV